jgi:hypothetical protein
MNASSILLQKKISVRQCARPPRFVYLVEENEKVSEILDKIFEDSYNRWGGLATLIVPVINGQIKEECITQIKLCDPDVIYTYAYLTKSTFDRLNQLTNPFLFLKHVKSHSCIPNYNPYKPNYKVSFLASLSLMPSVADDLQNKNGTKYLLRKHRNAIDDGFVSDNFGFFPLDAKLNIVCEKIQDYEPFTFLPKEASNLSDLDAKGEGVTNALELLERISRWDIYTPSLFCGKGLTSCFRPRGRIKIFVGDSFYDRINFWNARYSYCDKRDMDPACLAVRLPEKFVQDDVFLEAFKRYLSGVGNINQFYNLISYSLSTEKLRGLEEKFDISRFHIEETSVYTPYFPEDMEDQKFSHQEEIGYAEENIQTSEPIHFQSIPPSLQFLKNDAWVVDLEIERHHNLSFVQKEKQIWKLPRHHSIAKKFLPDDIVRVNAARNISFIKKPRQSLDNQYIKKSTRLTLPTDEAVFDSVFKGKTFYAPKDIRNEEEKASWWKICPSDKGKSLEKVTKAFGSLHSIFEYMDDPLWRDIFIELKNDCRICICKLFEKVERSFPKSASNKEEKALKKKDAKEAFHFLIKKKILIQKDKSLCSKCKKERPYELDQDVRASLDNCFHESWVLGELLMKFSETFFYLPQQDIFYSSDVNDKNEIDIICVCDGNFVIGEAKTQSSQFDQKTIDKLIKISKVVHPDVVLLAYEHENSDILPAKEKIESAGFKVKLMKIFSNERFSLFDECAVTQKLDS